MILNVISRLKETNKQNNKMLEKKHFFTPKILKYSIIYIFLSLDVRAFSNNIFLFYKISIYAITIILQTRQFWDIFELKFFYKRSYIINMKIIRQILPKLQENNAENKKIWSHKLIKD